ncbi:MAG: exopolyphosphatase [Calditrichaeota bacterium]|nr:exopolyphosphatase [Calditrichota bacterium]
MELQSSPAPQPGELGHRFAAIDVGSNALRLLFMQVLDEDGEPCFRKVSLFRMPLRLGTEAFISGQLSAATAERLVNSLKAFRLLMEAWQPLRWRACATSALRSLANADELARQIREDAGLDLELITGSEEAHILLANAGQAGLDQAGNYLYTDVGGGSTELTLLVPGRAAQSRSFPVGTVRLLTERTDPGVWQEMAQWLREHRPRGPVITIGSGGNINKLVSLVGLKPDHSLSQLRIQRQLERISGLTVSQRIRQLGLRPDRADVLPHALRIYLFVMQTARSTWMQVPQAGLADGLIRQLYHEWANSRQS